jgi:hypothetical protein
MRNVARVVLSVGALTPPARLERTPVLCPIRRVTGRPCPGCGLTRSITHALHGNLAASLHHHPLGLPLTALLSSWAVAEPRAGSWSDPQSWTSTPTRRRAAVVLAAGWAVWATRRSRLPALHPRQ